MLLPRGDEYNAAVQNPKIAFTDPDLRVATVEKNPMGLPKPYSGGFTTTYKLLNGQRAWAVRCFTREISDLQRRYQAIENFISRNNSKYFVEAKYLCEGIKVNGKVYPIIKMQWLEGEPLNIYLNNNHNRKEKIEKILSDFIALIESLEKFGIAHGDLQHGNIIVKNDSLYLIDYDGMYLPELSNLKTNEIGHVNYQHPKRSVQHYNKYIDRFSSIVIYIALKAITQNSSLWRKYDNSENILFKSQDFANLKNSSLIRDLSAISEIKPFIDRFIDCCYLELDKIPNLTDFISGNLTYEIPEPSIIPIRDQYPVINAIEIGSILEHFGKRIEVVGKVEAVKSSVTRYGNPYTFLNLGGTWPNHTFTIVLWKEGLDALKLAKIDPYNLKGKWVSVTGVITSYINSPQIVVESASQIQILSGESEANRKLKLRLIPEKPNILPNLYKKPNKRDEDILNEIYKNISNPPKTHPSTNKDSPSITTPPSPTPIHETSKPPIHSTPSRNSNNNGCIVLIIPAIIGALTIGAASDGEFWLIGAIIGGILGIWLQILKAII